jgi:putative solute:sodium symporter small subunit
VFPDPASRLGGIAATGAGPHQPVFGALHNFTSVPRCGSDLDQGGQPTMAPADTQANREEHWRRTTNLMLTHLGLWVFFGYIVHMFVYPLNKITIPILDFPLGFYMAAQGSLIAFVVMLFLFAKQQDKIDRDHGYAEDD